MVYALYIAKKNPIFLGFERLKNYCIFLTSAIVFYYDAAKIDSIGKIEMIIIYKTKYESLLNTNDNHLQNEIGLIQ